MALVGGQGGQKRNRQIEKKHRIKGNLHDKFITKTKFTFLAVQDSSIGDIVSQSLTQKTFDFSVSRALQSCGRLLRDF